MLLVSSKTGKQQQSFRCGDLIDWGTGHWAAAAVNQHLHRLTVFNKALNLRPWDAQPLRRESGRERVVRGVASSDQIQAKQMLLYPTIREKPSLKDGHLRQILLPTAGAASCAKGATGKKLRAGSRGPGLRDHYRLLHGAAPHHCPDDRSFRVIYTMPASVWLLYSRIFSFFN